MFGFRRKTLPLPPAGPVLDLSGDRLRRAFADLAEASRPTGGIARYVTALELKSALFVEVLGNGADAMTETEFLDLAAFIAPVRRRIGPVLEARGIDGMRAAITPLLTGAGDLEQRLAGFIAAFPQDKAHRWVRDLGAELLHFTAPAEVPLMTRWVWDARVGTGVIREIWHAEDVDAARIEVPDDLATFATLRAEIDGFLAAEGVFRDRIWYGDLLLSHIYAGYINDRGGQYLRNDFTVEGDPMLHTRRMLGLDAVDTETGRTRLRLIDGRAHEFGGSATARLAVLEPPAEDRHAHS
ncbi:hypothetical protein [Rhodobacter ferrooxidans]|uniref:Uncharacterized protein n=1 Tax=Rhodobacter ferrooxidans TaxID=371731 RepID=C8S5H0_9RHOB|nr:hypothetical protein [Rhodobacter sp. SW2]EEW23783.1 conserved hypothetical protein [Rhodobacter sp. SW2]